MRRQYNCRQCGVPKKGHTCPVLPGFGSYVPTSPPYSPTSPAHSPVAPSYLPIACVTPTPPHPLCTTSDEEEDKPLAVARGKQTSQVTKTNGKRKCVVIDDDEEEEEEEGEEEDAGVLLQKAARLLAKKQKSDQATLQEKYDEVACLKKMIAETDMKRKSEQAAATRVADALALKTQEMAALQEVLQQQGQGGRSTRDLWQIHEAVIQKIEDYYNQEYEELKHCRQVGSPVAFKERWVVVVDPGVELPVHDMAQEAIEKAITQTWIADEAVVVKDAYSQTLNGQKHVYMLRYDAILKSPVQINQETKKERVLSKKTAPPPTGKGAACIEMNNLVMPLVGVDSKFVFETEYAQMKNLPWDDEMYTRPSPKLEAMANTFLCPFITGGCASGKATGWCRPSLLFHFLSTAKNAFDKESGASCFFWAHGTRNASSILNDVFGMNMRQSRNGTAMGQGIYVACNPYVPMEWASHGSDGKLVLGVAITYNTDTFMQRYRMDAGVIIPREPADWKSLEVKHAIVLKNSQLNAAIPLGVIPTPP
jgi:hypothetical protein